MPKETFFNLDEEKREKIEKASIKEFTDNELHKARVSNIIKEAAIPRGSFYQYFEDIDDLYYYIIDKAFSNIFEEGYKHAELTDDIFEYARLTFEVDLKVYKNDKRHQFMMNIIKSIGGNIEYLALHNTRRRDYILNVLHQMDLSELNVKSEDDLIRVYEFIQNVKRMVIQKSLVNNLDIDKARESLNWHLDILQHGLLKEE